MLLGLVLPSPADVIVLVNGNEIRGEIVERDEKRIRVRLPLGEIEIPLAQIREIREEGATASRVGEARALAGDRCYDLALRWLDLAAGEGDDREAVVAARREILLAQARFLSSRGSFEAARRALAGALAIDPDSVEALRERAQLDERRAEAAVRIAAARSALAGGDPDAAIRGLDLLAARWPAQALDFSTDLFDALLARGDRRFLAERDHRAAHADYDRALDLEPGRRLDLESRWTTTFAIGILSGALNQGRAGVALPEIDEAEAAFPGHPLIGFLRGLALEELDREAEARSAYLRSLAALEPHAPPPATLEAAREALRQKLQIDPGCCASARRTSGGVGPPPATGRS
jgi:tetratricopeptide (TPR) repeat protein